MSDPVYIYPLLRHGLAVMIVGLVAGFVLAFSILGQISLSPFPFVIPYQMPGTTAAWARMHSGCLMNGLMLLVFAAIHGYFPLRGPTIGKIARCFIVVAWANVLFYFFGALSPNRGLALSQTPAGVADWASYLAYIPAVVGAGLLIGVLVTLLFSLPRKNEL